ncbi:cob(I)yrinic acid a,c-diamide adenosyltransferase [Candidatus Daviesbacteria bacterium]|nr:cob(I)yrinic acid a,c-diamide adenosyltransferase [Candidatus Daviesbacteria bacterium]
MTKSRLYTRTGDGGTTGLLGGKRIDKDDQLLEAYGTIDELSSWIGLARSVAKFRQYKTILQDIQHDLFIMGADLASLFARKKARQPRFNRGNRGQNIPQLTADDWQKLERLIDTFDEKSPPLRSFILPGGTELASRLHICRTITRRAERQLVKLSKKTKVRAVDLIYLNRLSDLFFAMARAGNRQAKVADLLAAR